MWWRILLIFQVICIYHVVTFVVPKHVIEMDYETSKKIFDTAEICFKSFNRSIFQLAFTSLLDHNKFKECIYCVASKTGIIFDNGHLVISKMIEYYPPDKVDHHMIQAVMEKCDRVNGITKQETVSMIFECIIEEGKTLLLPNPAALKDFARSL